MYLSEAKGMDIIMENRQKNVDEIAKIIQRRRFQILVHSYIYYRLNNNIVSNEQFDKWAEELIYLQKIYPEISEKVDLYEEFSDFTSIGDAVKLPFDKMPGLDGRARHLLRICDGGGELYE